MNSQKDIFLSNEGDNYFIRNKKVLLEKDYAKDKIIQLVKSLLTKKKKINILEIGCSSGFKLNYLVKNFSNIRNACGIDPSRKAIRSNKFKKIKLRVSTADKIPFNLKFDFIILGFCLYLCDDRDLFKIANEVYRLTKNNSFIIIEDFIQNKLEYKKYSHNKKIMTRKMNYIKMFSWHPKIRLIKKIKNNYATIALLKKVT